MNCFGIENGIFLCFGCFVAETSNPRDDWLTVFTNIVVYWKEFGAQVSICVLRLQELSRSLWFECSGGQEVRHLGVRSDQFPSDKSS